MYWLAHVRYIFLYYVFVRACGYYEISTLLGTADTRHVDRT